MIEYKTLNQLADDLKNISSATVLNYRNMLGITPGERPTEDISLMYELGGHTHVCQVIDDIRDMELQWGWHGEADINEPCQTDERYHQVTYLNNNAGGPTYYIPKALWQQYLDEQNALEEELEQTNSEYDAKPEDYKMDEETGYRLVHYQDLNALLQQRKAWLKIWNKFCSYNLDRNENISAIDAVLNFIDSTMTRGALVTKEMEAHNQMLIRIAQQAVEVSEKVMALRNHELAKKDGTIKMQDVYIDELKKYIKDNY